MLPWWSCQCAPLAECFAQATRATTWLHPPDIGAPTPSYVFIAWPSLISGSRPGRAGPALSTDRLCIRRDLHEHTPCWRGHASRHSKANANWGHANRSPHNYGPGHASKPQQTKFCFSTCWRQACKYYAPSAGSVHLRGGSKGISNDELCCEFAAVVEFVGSEPGLPSRPPWQLNQGRDIIDPS